MWLPILNEICLIEFFPAFFYFHSTWTAESLVTGVANPAHFDIHSSLLCNCMLRSEVCHTVCQLRGCRVRMWEWFLVMEISFSIGKIQILHTSKFPLILIIHGILICIVLLQCGLCFHKCLYLCPDYSHQVQALLAHSIQAASSVLLVSPQHCQSLTCHPSIANPWRA